MRGRTLIAGICSAQPLKFETRKEISLLKKIFLKTLTCKFDQYADWPEQTRSFLTFETEMLGLTDRSLDTAALAQSMQQDDWKSVLPWVQQFLSGTFTRVLSFIDVLCAVDALADIYGAHWLVNTRARYM